MKNLLIVALVFASSTASAQLEQGNKLVGIQTNLIQGDLYRSEFSFSVGRSESDYGLNLIPTIGWALKRNWLVGLQATFGFSRHKTELSGYDNVHTYYDLGIAPFTRLYLDLTKNKRWKVFGLAAIEIVNSQRRYSLEGQSKPIYTTSNTDAMGVIGGGLAHFGRKTVIDLNVCNGGLRLGLYKTFSRRK
jgi:hypothetical protein